MSPDYKVLEAVRWITGVVFDLIVYTNNSHTLESATSKHDIYQSVRSEGSVDYSRASNVTQIRDSLAGQVILE